VRKNNHNGIFLKFKRTVEQDVVFVKIMLVVIVGYEGTFIIKIVSIIWFINIQVMKVSA
jgi:hypothetical protein